MHRWSTSKISDILLLFFLWLLSGSIFVKYWTIRASYNIVKIVIWIVKSCDSVIFLPLAISILVVIGNLWDHYNLLTKSQSWEFAVLTCCWRQVQILTQALLFSQTYCSNLDALWQFLHLCYWWTASVLRLFYISGNAKCWVRWWWLMWEKTRFFLFLGDRSWKLYEKRQGFSFYVADRRWCIKVNRVVVA